MIDLTDDERETLKLAWSAIDNALITVPGFVDRLPIEKWMEISMLLGRLACGQEG